MARWPQLTSVVGDGASVVWIDPKSELQSDVELTDARSPAAFLYRRSSFRHKRPPRAVSLHAPEGAELFPTATMAGWKMGVTEGHYEL